MGIGEEEIKYVRETFEKKYADKISSNTYDDRDLRRLRNDNVFVTTFIRGPNRLDEGVDLVHECLLFRKEYEVNDMTEDTFEQWMWDRQALFYHKQTKSGHKILFLCVKKHKKDAAKLPLMKKFFVYWLECSFRANPLEKVVTFFDMSEAGLSNLDMDFIRFILTCFKLYYPTILEKLLIYEMPWIFNAAWKVIKTWLSQEAISKIKFATKSDIHTYIDSGLLFQHMGGPVSFDSMVYRISEMDNSAADNDNNDKRRVTFSDSTDSASSKHSASPNANNNAATRATSSQHHNTNSSAADGGTFTGRLLTISPADELKFVVDESGRETFDIITLTNTLMYPIAFKVKTTAPEKYRVRPSTGVVKPGEAFEVYVYLQPDGYGFKKKKQENDGVHSPTGFISTVDKDKFLVMAMEVSGESYDTSLWKTAPKDTIMEHRMRCVATGGANYNANVPVTGENSRRQDMGRTFDPQADTYMMSKIETQGDDKGGQKTVKKTYIMKKTASTMSNPSLVSEIPPLKSLVARLMDMLWGLLAYITGSGGDVQPPKAVQMEMLMESNNQLRRRMGWLILSHFLFFFLTLFFFAAFFCLGEDLFSSYLYFPFGYCVASSWSRRC